MKMECFTCNAKRTDIKNSYKYECLKTNKIIQLNDIACDKYEKSEMMFDIRKEMSKTLRPFTDSMNTLIMAGKFSGENTQLIIERLVSIRSNV